MQQFLRGLRLDCTLKLGSSTEFGGTLKGVGEAMGTWPWYHAFPASPEICQITLSSSVFTSKMMTRREPMPLPNMCVQKRMHRGLSGSVLGMEGAQDGWLVGWMVVRVFLLYMFALLMIIIGSVVFGENGKCFRVQ